MVDRLQHYSTCLGLGTMKVFLISKVSGMGKPRAAWKDGPSMIEPVWHGKDRRTAGLCLSQNSNTHPFDGEEPKKE